MIFTYGFDGSTEDLRSGVMNSSVNHDRIDTIEIIINGESFITINASPLNNIKAFRFRVGTHGLAMVDDHLIKENK